MPRGLRTASLVALRTKVDEVARARATAVVAADKLVHDERARTAAATALDAATRAAAATNSAVRAKKAGTSAARLVSDTRWADELEEAAFTAQQDATTAKDAAVMASARHAAALGEQAVTASTRTRAEARLDAKQRERQRDLEDMAQDEITSARRPKAAR